VKKGIRPEVWVLVFLILGLTVIVIYPLWQIVSRAFSYNGMLSLESIRQTWGDPLNQLALTRSLTVSGFGTLFSVLLGSLLAWIVTRTDIPHVRLVKTLLITPFLIPPFVGAIAWLQLLGPVGYLNKLLMWMTGSGEPLFIIYGPVGIILVMTFFSYPTVFLIMCAALEKMDATLEEAAFMSAAGKWNVLKDITVPIMAPAIGSAALLVFSHDMANFGIPAILGMPRGYLVLTTKIFQAIQNFGLKNNFNFASALAMELLIMAITALFIQKIYTSKKQYTVVTGKSAHPRTMSMGTWKYILFGFAMVLFICTTLAPITAIVLSSIIKAVGLPPGPANWTFNNYSYVLLRSQTTIRALRNSLFLGVASATITTILGGLISYYSVRSKLRGHQVADFIGSLPYTIPGTVLGLAIILAWSKPIAGVTIYDTIWIILLAYVTNYLTLSIRTTSASFAQIHESLDEAARMSGASWWRTMVDVVIPLVKPGLIASWFLVFMPSFRELTLSILLWSVGNETIGVSVFNLSQGGQPQYASAMGVILIVILFTGNFLTRKLTKGNYGF